MGKVKLMALVEKKSLREKVIEILEHATSSVDLEIMCHDTKKEVSRE